MRLENRVLFGARTTPRTFTALAASLSFFCPFLWAGQPAEGQPVANEEGEMNSKANMDDIVVGLIAQFSKSKSEAMDAAVKLGQMGRRTIPILADVLASTKSEVVKYYCTYSLSMIRDTGAAKILLPLVADEKADLNTRILAISAVGGAELEDGVKPLQQVATSDANGDLRFKALMALSVMIKSWNESEKIFTDGLSDTRDDIRQLCCKVCYQAAAVKIFYRCAEPKLLEMAESDGIAAVRINAIAALARMKSKRLIPVLIRIVGNANELASLQKQALAAAQNVTGVPFRNVESAKTWYEKFGKAEYENAAPLITPEEKARIEKERAEAETKAKEVPEPRGPGTQDPDAPKVASGEKNPEQPRGGSETRIPPPARTPAKGGKTLQDFPDDKPFNGVPIGD
ncbi:MAG: HEAT repeat domain-containing protein [Planctomycetes bacterium]|nr:HEAT repeat domain-containing protein [Planctomycetota bacterium]